MNNHSNYEDESLEQSNTAYNSEDEVEFVSKTQLKNESKALQKFGEELTKISKDKLEQLPLSDNTKKAVLDFHKQSGNIAKKRHLAYIGKCLRSDNAEEAKDMLVSDSFQQHRKQQGLEESQDKSVKVIEDLINQGDKKINQLIEDFPNLDRQSFRQLLRNLKNAKTESKKASSKQKLVSFLQDNKLI